MMCQLCCLGFWAAVKVDVLWLCAKKVQGEVFVIILLFTTTFAVYNNNISEHCRVMSI